MKNTRPSLCARVLFGVLPFLLISSAARAGQDPTSLLTSRIGAQTLEAEQVLVGRMPIGSSFRKRFAAWVPMLGNTGNLPIQYAPESRKVFEIPTLLLPRDRAAEFIAASGEAALDEIAHVRIDGKDYVRFFYHPLEASKFKSEIGAAPVDPIRWYATPSSSARSLYVSDSEGRFPAFIAKVSLDLSMGGGVRKTNDEEKLARSVMISEVYESAHAATEGRIPNTEKTWTFLPESLGIVPTHELESGTILRALPNEPGNTLIPWYSLIAERDGKKNWFEELFNASGYKNRFDFAWNELVKPLVELNAEMNFRQGLTTEFHQQNVLLSIDPSTQKVRGLAIRDMDSHWVDYVVRREVNHLPLPGAEAGAAFRDLAKVLKFSESSALPDASYIRYLREESVEGIFKYIFDAHELNQLMKLGDGVMVKRFNSSMHGLSQIDHIEQLNSAMKSIHSRLLGKRERAVFDEIIAEERTGQKSSVLVADRITDAYYAFKKLIYKARNYNAYGANEVIQRGQALTPAPRSGSVESIQNTLKKIEVEASDVVPKDALKYWLTLQRAFLRSPGIEASSVQFALTEDTRGTLHTIAAGLVNDPRSVQDATSALERGTISLEEMRKLSVSYAEEMELRLKGTPALNGVKTLFKRRDFIFEATANLQNPHWYTRQAFSIEEFIGLTAIPIEVCGLSEQVLFADGEKMPPTQFLFHDELHAKGLIESETEHFRTNKIALGSPEYYESVLDRVRLFRDFHAALSTVPNERTRSLLRIIWFDAFHDFFINQSPYRNLVVERESLARYVDRRMATNSVQRSLDRFLYRFGLGRFSRFRPGDILPSTSKISYKTQEIESALTWLKDFALPTPGQRCRQYLRSI